MKRKTITGIRAFSLILGVLVCVSFCTPVLAQERQQKIESAYLYSFFNYITWPGYASPQALTNPVICVYGDDPILPYLDYVRSKMSMERNLSVRVIKEKDEVAGCHILFMRHLVSPRMLMSLPGDVLTVIEPDDPLDSGGMVEFSQDGERVTIKINQSQLEQNGFSVSSRLLGLSKL